MLISSIIVESAFLGESLRAINDCEEALGSFCDNMQYNKTGLVYIGYRAISGKINE